LPAFAAAEGGLFAQRGVEVEFVDCVDAPDWTLGGFAVRPKAVGSGEVDFALTSVAYALAAQTEFGGRLGARFVAVSHQRNPIAAVVRADSGLERPADLGGLRAARWSMPWFAQEYAGALSYLGVHAPAIVDRSDGLDQALADGEVDVIPTWMDMTLHHRKAGFPIRTIPLDIGVYTTGLLAADRLPLELDVAGARRVRRGLPAPARATGARHRGFQAPLSRHLRAAHPIQLGAVRACSAQSCV